MGKKELQIIDNWKKYRRSYQDRAEEIIKNLTLREKISLMSGRLTIEEIRSQILNRKKVHYNETPYWAGGLTSVNLMPILFVDGSRGVVCRRGVYTGFPVAALRGATFDRKLEEKIGEAIGEEVIMAGGNLFGGCCLNLPYHPGWGRAQESYGEDSFLIGEMGASLVKGVQSQGVIACIKHFAFNSMENNRLNVNIVCDKRTEQEVFLPHFKKCIDSGAGAVMTAYNSYAGKMCGHNDYLIREVLKGKWGFDGFVLSDFTWGITDTVEAVTAGMDVEMPHTYYYGSALYKEVEEGNVETGFIDEAVLRIIRTMLAHGEYVLSKREIIKTKTNVMKNHTLLALDCAREGITLLENRNNLLPLECKGKGKKIVVLGTLAEEDNLGDRGSSRTYPPYVVNSVEGIWKSMSGAEMIVYSGENVNHCKKLAKEADALIIIAGNDYRSEGEHIKADEMVPAVNMFGGDRINGIGLPDNQIAMIEAVSEIRKDSVLVLNGGSAIMTENVRNLVGAIIMQFYPGMEGGIALGEILFGKVSPSGRLPFSVPMDEKDLVDIDWYADEQRYGRYHGYTLLDKNKKKARYEFGYGLSYTEFSYSNLNLSINEDAVEASVTIKNVGSVDSGHSVLLFVSAPGDKIERECKLLKGFERVYLKSSEGIEVTIHCKLDELKYYDEENDAFVMEAGTYRFQMGNLTEEIQISV